MSDKSARASHAKAILDDPLVVEAFDKIHAVIIADWKNAIATEHRERAWIMLHLLDVVKRHFITVIETGLLEQKNVTRLAKEKKGLFSL